MTNQTRSKRYVLTRWLLAGGVGAACSALAALAVESNQPRVAGDVAAEKRFDAIEAALARTDGRLRRLNAVQSAAAAAKASEPSVEETSANKAPEATSPELSEEERHAAAEERAKLHDEEQVGYDLKRENAFFATYFSELDIALRAQPADRELAGKLKERVPGTDKGLVEVVDVECSEELCRVEALHHYDDAGERARFLGALQRAMSPELARASIHMPSDDNRVLAYFAKRGKALPRPSTSFAKFMRGEG